MNETHRSAAFGLALALAAMPQEEGLSTPEARHDQRQVRKKQSTRKQRMKEAMRKSFQGK